MRILNRPALLGLAAALSLSACVGDGDTLLPSPQGAVGGDLFRRYVSLGNSITAGFQSNGINFTVQTNAYPVFLAQKAQADFNVPMLATSPLFPGTPCPPLMVAPLTPGQPGAGGCGRTNDPPFVSNLAVPGERIADLVTFNRTGSLGPIHTLLIGPQSQTEVMMDLNPSLVSVWVGNNDALAAALSGNLGPAAAGADSALTRLAAFQTSLNTLVERVDSVIDVEPGQEDAILIGVVDAVIAAPLIQPGAYFFLARDVTGAFQGKPVNNNCSPVTVLGQPNPLAANMVSFQIVTNPNFPEINCDPNAYPVGDPRRGTFLLDTQEQAIVRARIAAYNNAIQTAAATRGWVYVNPNAVLAPYLVQRDENGRYQQIRKCQDLAGAATPAQFQAAVLNSCPVTGPTAAPNFFGALISFDGVHPSTATHRILANVLAAALNARHGTQLPTS